MTDDVRKSEAQGGEAPPTPFQMLCATLAMQVQMALGLIEDPVQKKAIVELDAARQGIDMLADLEAKTKGNLDAREAKTLAVLLQQLRLLYVECARPARGDAPTP